MRVGIAADHEGYELKERILEFLALTDSNKIIDYGAITFNPGDDYPDFVIPLAEAVAQQKLERGIAICGSGIGANIAANKVRNARAGLVHDVFSARQGVEDDDMNIICIGARLVSFSLAIKLIQSFFEARFSGEPRHKRRLAKISEIEKNREIKYEQKSFTQIA